MSKQKFTSGEKVSPATDKKVITTNLNSHKWLGDKPAKKKKNHENIKTEEG